MHRLRKGPLLFFIYSAASSINIYFLSLFLGTHLHLNETQIGAVFALRAALTFLSAYLGGVLSDKFSFLLLFKSAFALQAITTALLVFVHNFTQFIWIYAPIVVAAGITTVYFDALFMRQASGRETLNKTILTFQSAKFLGLSLGAATTGQLLDLFSFNGTFKIVAVVFLLLTVLTGSLVELDVHNCGAEKTAAIDKAKTILQNRHTPSAVPLMVLSFVIALHWGAELTILPRFLEKNLALSHGLLGRYFGLEIVSLGVTTIALMALNTSVASFFSGFTGLALSIIGTVGTTSSLFAASLSFRMIHGVGDAILFAHIYGRLTNIGQDRQIGKLTGLFHMVNMAALVIGSLIYPIIADTLNLGTSVTISGLAMLFALPILLLDRQEIFCVPTKHLECSTNLQRNEK